MQAMQPQRFWKTHNLITIHKDDRTGSDADMNNGLICP